MPMSMLSRPVFVVNSIDTIPNAFAFTDQTNVAVSTTITSASITIDGIGGGQSAVISITGGTYSINGGAFTSSAGTVQNGNQIQARQTSSASNSTAIDTVVTIGGVSDTFTSTTEAGSGGGGAITPLIHVDFNGLTNLQSVYSTGSTAGKRWDAVPGSVAFAASYGMRASTAVARSGKTSSCSLSIKSGSDGDPSGGDTGTGMGAFGGYLNLSGANQISEGQEVWWGAWMYFPTGWSWNRLNGGDQVKFMRWQHTANSSHMDIYMLNNSYSYGNGETGSGSSGQQTGVAFRNEWDAKANADTDFTVSSSTGRIPLNQWCWVEQYVYAHSDATLAKRRLWIDGVFVREQVGSATKWRGNDGSIHTKTVSGGIKTLLTSVDKLDSIAHFTYWNNYAPQDQTMYIGNIAIHKTAGDLSATDEFGNLMMGINAV